MEVLDQLADRVGALKGDEARLRAALVAAGDQLDRRAAAVEAALEEVRRDISALSASPADAAPEPFEKRLAYVNEVGRVRQAVEAAVPADAVVLVVSKGDEDLLSLGGRRAWHFPRGEGGVYAGYYPADGAAAVAHLEALRGAGAQYLVLPNAAFWWLTHYPELREHLESRCHRVHGDGHAVVFRLAPAGQRTGPTPGPPGRNGQPAARDLYREVVEDVRAVVRRVTPVGAVVLVVSKGDEELVRLGAGEGWHFPRAEDGRYAGHHPADGTEAVAHVERLRARGADYLVFPNTAFWWLTYYRELRDYLDARYRRAHADASAVAYDLSGRRGGLLARLLGRPRGGA